MGESALDLEMDELESAEEFLDYFDIEYEPSVVQVNRLHILQRFHDYVQDIEALPQDKEEQHALYAGLLTSAYHDFVQSDALHEKVFQVFRMHEPATVAIPLADLSRQVNDIAPKV